MAEFGAHLAAPTIDFPSIFEVLAQEKLFNSLQSAIAYVYEFRPLVYSRDSNYEGPRKNYINPGTFFNWILNHYYLKYYGASFAEHFYGLKRIPTQEKDSNTPGYKLPLNIHYRSLLTLVLLPWLKKIIDQIYEIREDNTNRFNRTKPLETLLEAFLCIYPFFLFCWNGLSFAYRLAYTLKKSKYHSPLQHLSGTKLCILNENDIIASRNQLSQLSSWKNESLKQLIPKLCQEIGQRIFVTVSTGFAIGAFFLQFLEWWQTTEHVSSNFIVKDSIPAAPQQYLLKHKVPDQLCPVCLKGRKNETALATSGFVFCYSCIHHYLAKYNKCPVTGYPSSYEHLIKIHQPES